MKTHFVVPVRVMSGVSGDVRTSASFTNASIVSALMTSGAYHAGELYPAAVQARLVQMFDSACKEHPVDYLAAVARLAQDEVHASAGWLGRSKASNIDAILRAVSQGLKHLAVSEHLAIHEDLVRYVRNSPTTVRRELFDGLYEHKPGVVADIETRFRAASAQAKDSVLIDAVDRWIRAEPTTLFVQDDEWHDEIFRWIIANPNRKSRRRTEPTNRKLKNTPGIEPSEFVDSIWWTRIDGGTRDYIETTKGYRIIEDGPTYKVTSWPEKQVLFERKLGRF
jgi:hypothetical protein